MSEKTFFRGFDRKNISLSSQITELRRTPDGTSIIGNIRHYPLSEEHYTPQKGNIGELIKEFSEFPFGDDVFSIPKIAKPSLDKKDWTTSGTSSHNTLDISTFVDQTSTKYDGQTIPSNIQHISLIEPSPSNVLLDIHKVVADIQNSTSMEATLRDKTGIIQKNMVAKAYNDIAATLSHILKFMIYRKMLCSWNRNVWCVLEPTSFITLVRQNLPDEPLLNHFSTKNYEEIFKLILTDPNLQVSDDEVKRPSHLITFNDGVIDILTGQRMLPDPKYFCFAYINMSIKDVGRGKGIIFERFIDNCTGGDRKIRQRILEMIGLVISGYMLKVIFLILGPKNTGKSQFILLLRLLVGEMNCESLKSLNDFSDRWTTGRLLGKKLCICPDVPKETINAQSLATIKQLCGGDLVYGDQKYKIQFSYINEAKLVFASNHKLKIADADDEEAFIDRIVTIPFNNTIPRDQMIPDLFYLLFQERGYIVEQAIVALQDLQRRNFIFTEIDTPAFFEDTSSVSDCIIDFCKEECIFSPDSECTTHELYKSYYDYCCEIGQQAEAFAVFARTISNRFPELERLRKANGIQQRGFRGITLRTIAKGENHHEK